MLNDNTMDELISFIVPFANARDTIRQTIDALACQGPHREIILVDDCSSDNTSEEIASYIKKNADVRYVRNSARLGAAASRNIGARLARGEILVFVDADIVVPANTAAIIRKNLSEGALAHAKDGIMAHRAEGGAHADWVSEYKNHWTSYNFSKLRGYISTVSSACLAIKKNIFFDVGGFRTIPHAEDVDLGWRLSRSGYHIYFDPELIVSHTKRFTVLSLLKREFIAAREGIKIKIEHRDFRDLVVHKKIFTVNRNFVFSFFFALAGTLGIMFSVLLMSWKWSLVSLAGVLALWMLNREFMESASLRTKRMRTVVYVLLLVVQLHALGAGGAAGIFAVTAGGIKKMLFILRAYSRSVMKLFIKTNAAPEQVTFFVTNRCNLNCHHCFVEHTECDELEPEEIDQLTRRMPRINYVTITGGEPFLRSDIAAIAHVLHRNLKPLVIMINTNGYLTETVLAGVKEILDLCPGQNILLKISLDGPRQIHDEMRQAPGAFDKANATYVRLSQLKQSYNKLSLGIITTYTKQNKEAIELFYDTIIAKLKPDQYAVNLQRPKAGNELNEEIIVHDFRILYDRINAKAARYAVGFLKNFRLAYKVKIAEKLEEIYKTKRYPARCFAGILNVVFGANGDVTGCEQLAVKLGNVREAGYNWEAIWHSDNAREFRKRIREKSCFCLNECFMAFNLAYNIKELPGVLRILARLHARKRPMGEQRRDSVGGQIATRYCRKE